MPGWSELISAAGHDPLVVIFLLALVGAVVAQLLARRYPPARAIVRVVFLVLLTIGFARAGILPYRVQPSTGDPFLDLVHGALKIIWWLWTAWFVVGLVRAFLIVERRPRESRLLQDLLAGVAYLAALFAITAYVFELPIQGLLATSGVLAIILGLAMQSTLSDLFSGIVLDFSRPYLPGDWVNFEGTGAGKVIEMNWRATHVLTERHDLMVIPNSTIAKSRITNASWPTAVHGVSITVQLDGGTQPAIGQEAIEHAVLNCRSIREDPPPAVKVKAITAGYVEFEIMFFVASLGEVTPTQNELFNLIYRHSAAAGIRLTPDADQPTALAAAAPASPKSKPEALLGLVAIFRGLTPEERQSVAAHLRYAAHERGTLVRAGEVTKSLFIIGEGVVSAIHEPDEIELARFGPGDHYGEIGMLTGQAVASRLDALVPVVTYELTKEDLAPILKTHPVIAHELARILALRVDRSRLAGSPEIDEPVPQHQLSEWFFERLHRMFDAATVNEPSR
jgi:small-conductance mechanosensitive channel